MPKKLDSIVKLRYKKKIYEIKADKILYVLSALENKKNITLKTEKELKNLMKKYKLIDEIFLKPLSNN